MKINISPTPTFILFARFVGASWIIVGIVMIGLTLSRAASGWNSQNWPTAPGKIVASSVGPPSDISEDGYAYYKVRITYMYSPVSTENDKRVFLSSRISFRGFIEPSQSSYSLDEARRITSEYPTGKILQVYYNPKDPQSAVLIPGENIGTFGGSVIGVVLIVFGVILCFFIRSFFREFSRHRVK